MEKFADGTDVPMVTMWKNRPIKELSHGELVDALDYMIKDARKTMERRMRELAIRHHG